MKKILIIVGVVTLLALIGVFVYMRTTTRPDMGTVLSRFPETPLIDRTATQEDSKATTSLQSRPATADTAIMLPWQKDALLRVLRDVQPIPSDAGTEVYQLLDAPEYKVEVMVATGPTYRIVFNLKKKPLYLARELAEQGFVKLFNGERDDLCGFPIAVNAPPGHPLAESGNLGLEYCGASKITEGQ